MAYQRIIIEGNLGKDPETRTTQGGMAITTLSIAVNERVKDGDEWKDHTEWFRVVCFGKTAENSAAHLAKGRAALVEGRLRQREYEKDGQQHRITEVLADRVVFIGGKGDQQSTPPRAAPASKPKPKPAPPPDDGTFIDDDLPF